MQVACYHRVLVSVVDVVADSFDDPALTSLGAGRRLTEQLATLVIHALDRYPSAEPALRARLHDLCRLRFPSCEGVAKRYLEFATGGTTARAEEADI